MVKVNSSNIVRNIVVTHHSTRNIDSVDISNPVDNKENHQFIDDLDTLNVSINLNNGEVTPKITPQNNIYEFFEDNDNFKFYKDSDVLTLKPSGEELLLNVSGNNLYSSAVDIVDNVNSDIVNVNTNLSGFSTNKLGNTFYAYVVNKNHTNDSDLESFDYFTLNLKDFNFGSVSDNDFHKSECGNVKDYDSEFNSIKYLFSPNCESIKPFSTYSVFNTNDEHFKNREEDLDNITEFYLDFISYNSSVSFGLSGGIRDIGYVDKDKNGNYYKCYVGTKVRSMSDFKLGDEKSYIYNNINRPLIFKPYDVDNGTFGNTIIPAVSQSYKFNRDYIISKIKPQFIFPSNLPEIYDNENIKLVITAGFLIDGKVNENGFVTTNVYTGFKDISENVLNKSVDFKYPIFVPKGREFFIGFSLFVNEDNNSVFKIKCLDNGKYDMSGNLVSFPDVAETKCFIYSEEYQNKLLKVDLYVNTYETLDKHKITLKRNIPSGGKEKINVDRCILFSYDFHPSNTILNYYVYDSENVEFALVKNKEYITDKTRVLSDNKMTVEMSTNDKYVSPIINLGYKLNLLSKTYNTKKTHYTLLANPYGIYDKLSSLKFKINNINCWHNKIDNTGSSFYNQLEGLKKTYLFSYLLRVNFDYHLNNYNFDADNNVIRNIYVNLISKVTGERFSVWSPIETNSELSSIDGNRIDIVDLNENGWKRANCEYIINYVLDPSSAVNQNSVLKYYPFLSYLDQFEVEVGLLLSNHNDGVDGVEGIRNIMCSVDTIATTSN